MNENRRTLLKALVTFPFTGQLLPVVTDTTTAIKHYPVTSTTIDLKPYIVEATMQWEYIPLPVIHKDFV